jgi:hypothetical protein
MYMYPNYPNHPLPFTDSIRVIVSDPSVPHNTVCMYMYPKLPKPSTLPSPLSSDFIISDPHQCHTFISYTHDSVQCLFFSIYYSITDVEKKGLTMTLVFIAYRLSHVILLLSQWVAKRLLQNAIFFT